MCGVVYEVVVIYGKKVYFEEKNFIEEVERVVDKIFVVIELDKVLFYLVCIVKNVIVVLSL